MQRQKCTSELLDLHSRFVGQLEVLSSLWRFRIAELTQNDTIVNSIFPSLDAIISMSNALAASLARCSRGIHPLVSIHTASRVSVERMLVMCFARSRRARWSFLYDGGPMQLELNVELSVGQLTTVGQQTPRPAVSAPLSADPALCSLLATQITDAMGAPAAAIANLSVTARGSGTRVMFEVTSAGAGSVPAKVLIGRRVDNLLAAIAATDACADGDAASPPSPAGAGRRAARVLSPPLSSATGLQRVTPAGERVSVPQIDRGCRISKLELEQSPRGQIAWGDILMWIAPGDPEAKARVVTAARAGAEGMGVAAVVGGAAGVVDTVSVGGGGGGDESSADHADLRVHHIAAALQVALPVMPHALPT